jgi:hypothetical protein
LNNSISGQYWQVFIAPTLRLLITRADGQIVSDVTFPSSTLLTLFFSYAAGTGWRLALVTPAQLNQDLAEVICPVGQSMLASEAGQLTGQNYLGVTTLKDGGIQGCLLDLQQNEVEKGHFVWRFGALMAADAKAHDTLPQLPVASPAEIAAVSG